MEFLRKVFGGIAGKLPYYGPEFSICDFEADIGFELDPRGIRPREGRGNTVVQEASREIDVANPQCVVEGKATGHHPNDGVFPVIQYQSTAEYICHAVIVTLPELVIEHDNGLAAALGVREHDPAS